MHTCQELIDNTIKCSACITNRSTTRLGNRIQLVKENHARSSGASLVENVTDVALRLAKPQTVLGELRWFGSVRLCHSNSGLTRHISQASTVGTLSFHIVFGCYLSGAVYLLCSPRIILAFLTLACSLAKARILWSRKVHARRRQFELQQACAGNRKRTISKSINLLISSCPCSVNLLDLGNAMKTNAFIPSNAALMSARNARGVFASASQFGDGLQNTKLEVK
jgi:hypothetical protein